MMRNTLKIVLAVFVLESLISLSCYGTERAPLRTREYSSDTNFVLKVTPSSDYQRFPGHCLGELFQSDNSKRKLIWSRILINNIAPAKAMVSPSGRYVVTLDDWDNNNHLPLVIYGENGRLVQVHNVQSINLERSGHGQSSWRENAIIFFGSDENTLIIRLQSGKTLIFDLSDGAIMDDDWYETYKGWYINETKWNQIRKYAHDQAVIIAQKQLESTDSKDRLAGIIALGQMNSRDSIPKIKLMLTDESSYIKIVVGEPAKKVYFIRKAAKEALELMGVHGHDTVVEEGE